MKTQETLHMNKGEGKTSYAMNSDLQDKIISMTNPATKKAIVEILCSTWPEKIGIADLGCSSGPNALRVILEIIDVIHTTSHAWDQRAPKEIVVYLNDLFNSDFNNIFASLPSFYGKMRKEKRIDEFGSCFVSAVPGTFYGRLFPTKSLHFAHSSSSLNWRSQTPAGLEDEWGKGLNKGKIYISKSSPQCVFEAYSRQFQDDFSLFLKSRSQEMVLGGRMVLSLIGRESLDPTSGYSWYQIELLANALMSMVSEGLIAEEKVDSFNLPFYIPCLEELQLEIEKEGSFMVEVHEAYEIDLGYQLHSDSEGRILSSGECVARTVRATIESMLEFHFGSHIMDELFRRFGELVENHLSKTKSKHINFVISLIKQV